MAELHGHTRYEVLELIGAGAMGTVYRAMQKQLNRVVAIKVLRRGLTGRAGFAERFCREVQSLARLNHPNIVQAYDADHAGDSHFLVMEFVAGESLDAVVRRCGPLPVAEACRLAVQVAIGLQHAHEQGLVHRDIKPGNLLLTPEGVVKIADFGLSRVAGVADVGDSESAPVVLGTPEYMAPEQARNSATADIRSDLYSLGCTLYFLLAGKPPFSGASHLQTLLDHQDTNPPELPGTSDTFRAILKRLLAKDPHDRYATPAEAAAALAVGASAGQKSSLRSARGRWLAVAITAVVMIAIAGVCVPAFRDEPAISKNTHKETTSETPAKPVAIAPMPRVGTRHVIATTDQVAVLRRQAVDQVVEWVRTNNRWSPDSEIVEATAAKIEKAMPRVNMVIMTLGAGLLKSGKSTVIAAQPGAFFTFDLTPEQCRELQFRPMGYLLSAHTQTIETRLREPRVELSNFRLDTADAHPPHNRITGTVDCLFPSQPGKDDHLRITHYRSDGRRITYLHYPKQPPTEGRVTLHFSANPIAPVQTDIDRLFVLFAEWATRRAGEDVIESNTTAALLLLDRE
jgi:tRNA A-37 threonylcarbamoyl transferase component Bud32